jgi:hypothetical protein
LRNHDEIFPTVYINLSFFHGPFLYTHVIYDCGLAGIFPKTISYGLIVDGYVSRIMLFTLLWNRSVHFVSYVFSLSWKWLGRYLLI